MPTACDTLELLRSTATASDEQYDRGGHGFNAVPCSVDSDSASGTGADAPADEDEASASEIMLLAMRAQVAQAAHRGRRPDEVRYH